MAVAIVINGTGQEKVVHIPEALKETKTDQRTAWEILEDPRSPTRMIKCSLGTIVGALCSKSCWKSVEVISSLPNGAKKDKRYLWEKCPNYLGQYPFCGIIYKLIEDYQRNNRGTLNDIQV